MDDTPLHSAGSCWSIDVWIRYRQRCSMASCTRLTFKTMLTRYQILGDSIVGITFVRNSVSASFIFTLDPWFKAVGIQNSIPSMAIITAFFLLHSLVFLKYGKALRVLTASKYRQLASKQMTS